MSEIHYVEVNRDEALTANEYGRIIQWISLSGKRASNLLKNYGDELINDTMDPSHVSELAIDYISILVNELQNRGVDFGFEIQGKNIILPEDFWEVEENERRNSRIY